MTMPASVMMLDSSTVRMTVSAIMLGAMRVASRLAADGETLALLYLGRLIVGVSGAISVADGDVVVVFLGSMGMGTSVKMIVNDLHPADDMMMRARESPLTEPQADDQPKRRDPGRPGMPDRPGMPGMLTHACFAS